MKKETCKKWYGYKHDFEKWKEINRGTTEVFKDRITGFWILQQRICKRCGYIELDKKVI